MTFYFLRRVRGPETRAQRAGGRASAVRVHGTRICRVPGRSRTEIRAQQRLAAGRTPIKNGRARRPLNASDDFLLVERFEKRLGILAMYEEGHVLGF
jgi:hypothetical protein